MQTLNDLFYSLRRLGNSPAFTATSIFVIVLGLALYLVSYSFGYNFSKPLPFEDGDRYVAVKTVYPVGDQEHFGSNFDGFAYKQLKQQVTSFSEFGAYRYVKYSISDGEVAQSYVGAQIEPSLLHNIAVAPVLGRLLEDDDALPDSEPVVLLSHDIWQNYYAADPNIIGQTSRINGELYTVIGVMPENFDYPFSQHVWLALDTSQDIEPDGNFSLGALGVLKPQVSLEAATAEMSALMGQLVEEYPDYYSETEANVQIHAQMFVTSGNVALLFQLVSLLILLLATLNLGALLFVRGNARQQELAVRFAMGASGWQISRQILLESLVLCVVGLLLSLGIADFILSLVEEKIRSNAASSDYPGTLASWIDMTMDVRAITIAASLMLSIWLFSGSFAAYRATRTDNSTVLTSGKGGTDRNRVVFSRLIVGFEIVASCFLLIVCGLLTAVIYSSYRTDFGSSTDNYYTGMFELTSTDYQLPSQRREFLQDLQRELIQLPETSDATIATALPGQGAYRVRYNVEDRDLRRDNLLPEQSLVLVADNYFESLQVPLIEGRSFYETDTADSLSVVIIDEVSAELLWPDESPLGKRIQIDPRRSEQWHTIVGVTTHIIHGTPLGNLDREPTLYRPIAQSTPTNFSLAIELNQQLSTQEAERIIVETVQSMDRDLPVTSIRPLQRVTEMSMQGMDLFAQFAVACALGTFLLAIVGVYVNISRAVTQRTSEIGIRRALGSSNGKIIWVFLREAGNYLFWGASIGGVSAVVISGTLAGFFNNILDFLPAVVPLVIFVIAVLVVLASYLPARRAIAIEPGEALHYE